MDYRGLIQDMVLSAIPAAGFAMVFNVPRRALVRCALLGGTVHAARMVTIAAGCNLEWATFLAAVLAGCTGIHWSRSLLTHPKVFTVAAVIPMFPGTWSYSAMIAALDISRTGYSEGLMNILVSNFLEAVSLVGILSVGLSLPGLWIYQKHPRI